MTTEVQNNSLKGPVRERVIALHCSGADASAWNSLAAALGEKYELVTPEHYGTAKTGPWTGTGVFTVADEAAQSMALIDAGEAPVHLVGHSYGGAVALHLTLARPHKVRTLAVYEPTLFHLLGLIGSAGYEAYGEICGVARRMSADVSAGDDRLAVAHFVDYWNGPGIWQTMRPSTQDALTRWAPKGPLEFAALLGDTTPVEAYRGIGIPVLVMRGQHAPLPTRTITHALMDLLPRRQAAVIDGAGHMGPLTHAAAVAARLAGFIGGSVANDAPGLG